MKQKPCKECKTLTANYYDTNTKWTIPLCTKCIEDDKVLYKWF